MKKIIPLFTILIALLLFATSCTNKSTKSTVDTTSKKTVALKEGLSKAYFASGCFWCVEAIFENVKGVEEAVSGYAGGESKNPTYEQVSSGRSKHAEAVEIFYDAATVDFATLVKVFFGSHDPTTFNRQGPDAGPQYRSIAFYQNEEEKNIIEQYITELTTSSAYASKIVTEVVPLDIFYPAEDYHQDYERKHPNNSYIRNVSVPRLLKFEKKYPELLKKKH